MSEMNDELWHVQEDQDQEDPSPSDLRAVPKKRENR